MTANQECAFWISLKAVSHFFFSFHDSNVSFTSSAVRRQTNGLFWPCTTDLVGIEYRFQCSKNTDRQQLRWGKDIFDSGYDMFDTS